MFYSRVLALGPGICCFTDIASNHARFLWIFRVADLLSNSKRLLLKDYTTGFIYRGQKKAYNAVQKMKFASKQDFFSKCAQICRKLRSHSLKKSIMTNLLSPRSHGLYRTGNAMFIVNNSKARIIK